MVLGSITSVLGVHTGWGCCSASLHAAPAAFATTDSPDLDIFPLQKESALIAHSDPVEAGMLVDQPGGLGSVKDHRWRLRLALTTVPSL